jgi:hypothetical protein
VLPRLIAVTPVGHEVLRLVRGARIPKRDARRIEEIKVVIILRSGPGGAFSTHMQHPTDPRRSLQYLAGPSPLAGGAE